MFGIKEIKDDVVDLRYRIDQIKNTCIRYEKGIVDAFVKKNDEIAILNRKVDTLLDYLGLEYFPERVFVDCIEEVETEEKKGKK